MARCVRNSFTPYLLLAQAAGAVSRAARPAAATAFGGKDPQAAVLSRPSADGDSVPFMQVWRKAWLPTVPCVCVPSARKGFSIFVAIASRRLADESSSIVWATTTYIASEWSAPVRVVCVGVRVCVCVGACVRARQTGVERRRGEDLLQDRAR